MTPDVHDYYEDNTLVAKIDNTSNEGIIVILLDDFKGYKQRFWSEHDNNDLVERCKLMRKLNIPSL